MDLFGEIGHLVEGVVHGVEGAVQGAEHLFGGGGDHQATSHQQATDTYQQHPESQHQP